VRWREAKEKAGNFSRPRVSTKESNTDEFQDEHVTLSVLCCRRADDRRR
jgi:hypothetical protein